MKKERRRRRGKGEGRKERICFDGLRERDNLLVFERESEDRRWKTETGKWEKEADL